MNVLPKDISEVEVNILRKGLSVANVLVCKYIEPTGNGHFTLISNIVQITPEISSGVCFLILLLFIEDSG